MHFSSALCNVSAFCKCKCSAHCKCTHRSTMHVHCTLSACSTHYKCTQKCTLYIQCKMSVQLQLHCACTVYTASALSGAQCTCSVRCRRTYCLTVHLQRTLYVHILVVPTLYPVSELIDSLCPYSVTVGAYIGAYFNFILSLQFAHFKWGRCHRWRLISCSSRF